MTRALEHRGPDDEGYFWSPRVGLGSRRLSIIDLSPTGRMPIWNESRTVAVVQNGEIYNYQILRKQLQANGHHFVGESDTEVIVHLYEEWGQGCFDRLDGMFAIAIWDGAQRRLILARDRFGEKPLYYYQRDGVLAFASELKALIMLPAFQREVNFEALRQFLTLGYILAPDTPYRAVKKLLPGHFGVFEQDTGEFRTSAYWVPPAVSEPASPKDEAEYEAEFLEIFSQSVQSRLISDVPVGAFLSGGVDSSLVVAQMARLQSGTVRTFSIGYASSNSKNENVAAEQVARHLGVEHSNLWVGLRDVTDIVEKLPWLWDEPLGDPALISVYLIAKKARESGFKVMLSGDGGDELFLGYPVFGWLEKINPLLRLPRLVRAGLAKGLGVTSRILRSSRIEKGARCLNYDTILDVAYYLTGYGAWPPELIEGLTGSDFSITNNRFAATFNLPAGDGRPLLRQAAALLATYLSDNNQARMDRASMANGVETRAPLLNPKIAEFAAALPLQMKIRGPVHKYLLRKALSDLVPGGIADRPKRGFDALPMAAWLRGDLSFLVQEYLDPPRLRRQGLFRPDMVSQVVAEHMRGGQFDHWWKIWLLIVIQVWLEHWDS